MDYAGLTLPIIYQGTDKRQYLAIMATDASAASRGADGKPLDNEALVAVALRR